MTTQGYLGIDAGTQGLSTILTDTSLQVIAVGEGKYDMVPGLADGCYEQNPNDWVEALRQSMNELRNNLPPEHADFEVLAIGISGQMHGEVLADEHGNSLGHARLWCDSRNDAEEVELTAALGVKMPKRITAARWLWTTRKQPEKALAAKHMTTPAGWISFRLTGQWNLGIGDASGMFPIDQETLNYDSQLLEKFENIAGQNSGSPLSELLPQVVVAGEDAGQLHEAGAEILGLPVGTPIAAAEGDQPAALAGSLIGNAGMVSCSFGTSVCANSVGDRAFQGVNQSIDHFCAVDGKPINMVWLRNGTTYMNCVANMFAEGIDTPDAFSTVIQKAVEANADCGGLLALPFVDDEPGLDVHSGGTAMLMGLNPSNATPGNAVKAALLSTMFNLLLGSQVLDEQGYPRNELVLTGGLSKTPELAQILADVFETPVTLLDSADEGTAWGAALLAHYRYSKLSGSTDSWEDCLENFKSNGVRKSYSPQIAESKTYGVMFQRYQKLVGNEKALAEI